MGDRRVMEACTAWRSARPASLECLGLITALQQYLGSIQEI
jgi:hypothetical protein